MVSKKPPIIGIDLGTTFCCVGYLNLSKIVEIIENREGSKTTPSYVAFTNDDTIIGRVAKQKSLRIPENVLYDTKRLIGQKYGETFLASKEKHNWPFKISPGPDENLLIEITRNGKIETYKPEEISAILLKHMKHIVEERLDTKVREAVVTVPAHFNYHQRTATKKAGELAGLNIVKIINEPTAAALAYIHINKISGEAKHILVFDLGGGTLDVSILTVRNHVITVKATAGDTALGGRDFDNNLTELIATKFGKLYKLKIKPDTSTMRRIKEQSERIKIDLSTETVAYLDLPILVDGKEVGLEITRYEFEQKVTHLCEVCMNTVEDCLRDAKYSKPEIDIILLVGGSTRIPLIQETLSKSFHGKHLTKAVNPDEAVAYGAAVQAAMYNPGEKMEVNYEVNDVTPLSLGVDTDKKKMCVMIPRNSTIPVSFTKKFQTTFNNQTYITFPIYEGERLISEHNILIGNVKVKVPPKPAFYPVYITFHINSDGILDVKAKSTDGNYTGVAITYEKFNTLKTSNIIKDAEINKTKDNLLCKIADAWNELLLYNEKMKSICDYDKKGITEKEKETIKNISEEVSDWLKGNDVEDGNPQKVKVIEKKREEVEKLYEPIVNSYGYYVKDMLLSDFHDLLSK